MKPYWRLDRRMSCGTHNLLPSSALFRLIIISFLSCRHIRVLPIHRKTPATERAIDISLRPTLQRPSPLLLGPATNTSSILPLPSSRYLFSLGNTASSSSSSCRSS